ncbi:putative E3 ubiquitin-protein ligase RING1 [Paratrimastix pyriformis]|uniref:E3 ubiquitin-protein ligase RING1 n=1 Tax=Paratrimastix pyriformis TaxID=342808 RepID=A0ABQ8UGX8_9EUKA|nr:putative E3 ubiquitin-protein ligase RING1 [Paratrimastix pyriformis]
MDHQEDPSQRLFQEILRESEELGAENFTEMLDVHMGPPPPASLTAIEDLDEVTISQKHIDEATECPICCTPFRMGAVAIKMPCKHLFHDRCLLSWLKEHNTCPMCRHELPSSSYLYEMRKLRLQEQQAASAGHAPAPAPKANPSAPPRVKPPRELSLMFS